MFIVCPHCRTSYDVAVTSLGESGRSVRCVRCRTVWFAAPGSDQAADAEGFPAIDATAASAQYRQRAGAAADPRPSDEAADGCGWDGEVASVDPNLAARAADRPSGWGDISDAGAPAGGMAAAAALAAHDAPPLAPDGGEATGAALVSQAADDIETVAARRARFEMRWRGRRLPRPSHAIVILALLAVVGGILGWRAEIVRRLPQTASFFGAIGLPVNLRGLAFRDVTTAKEVHEGVPVLLVQGTIANVSRQALEVPRMRFAVRGRAGNEVYVWTALPGRPILAPGEAQPFQSRLASPPAEAREVVVRFFNRRDAAGVTR
jgi:predicted Zn finger-like uncharacterized protein